MTKLLRIICISFCFEIYYLQSAEYNVITVSRNPKYADYSRLETKEVYLVFAQLARCFRVGTEDVLVVIDNSIQLTPANKAELRRYIPTISTKSINVPDIPTVVVFNEAFFGKDNPLPRMKQSAKSSSTSSMEESEENLALSVEGIIDIYREFKGLMPNAYLYINFLYEDIYTPENIAEYGPQIEDSQNRYAEVLTEEETKHEDALEKLHPSFQFDSRIEKILDDWWDRKYNLNPKNSLYLANEIDHLKTFTAGVSFGQRLLFNQTKIFYTGREEGKEIGHYNKSSYYQEYKNTLTDRVYYVIGNFKTPYSPEFPSLPIDCLICYDINVISNESYQKHMMPKERICAFSSNSTALFPYALSKNKNVKNSFFICVDRYDWKPSAAIDGEKAQEDYFLCGVFKYERKNLLPIEKNVNFSSLNDDFILKIFTLTTD